MGIFLADWVVDKLSKQVYTFVSLLRLVALFFSLGVREFGNVCLGIMSGAA